MGLWYPLAVTSLRSRRLVTLTLVMLACTIELSSSLDMMGGVLKAGRNQGRPNVGEAPAAGQETFQQQQQQQPPKKSAQASIPKRMVALNRDNGIPNNVNSNSNNLNNNNVPEKQPIQSGGQNLARNSLQQQAGDRGKALDPQALARQQRERLEEGVRLNNELQNRLRIHEEERQKKELQAQEREQQRQQRQQMLDDYRKAEQNARGAPRQSEREKEQQWLDDIERKSVAKFKQQQQEQQQQQMQQQPNANLNNLNKVAKSENDANDINRGQLSNNEGASHLANKNAVNTDSSVINKGLPNAHSNKLARDSNSSVVKEKADLEGNRVLPVVKYPRDDGVVINGNSVNKNRYFVDAKIPQDSNRRHDQPEVINRISPIIRVEERQDLDRLNNPDQNVNNDHNFNSNNNNNDDNNNSDNNDNGFNNNNNNNINNREDVPHRNNDFQDGADMDRNADGQIGGLHINWDWDDFSIMFDNYGRAEMKVRRAPKPTTGEPWPLPQYYSKKEKKVYKISKDLRFIPTGVTCDVLEEAMTRHLQRVLRGNVEDMYDNLQNAEGSPLTDPSLRYERDEFMKAPLISRVELKVRKPCTKYPTLESDESYDLVVKKKKTFIYANEVWGLLRGLETLGHLVWRGTDGVLYVKETVISDYPRFAHRGLHIDTSRHFLFKEILLDIMDSMEMNKLNVFHWHIVDDQSFPYESKVFPELSRKGAFHPTYVYSLEDIAELIEYARFRGIRVLPEFDTPGHTYAWGLGRPELLTQCFSDKTPVKGYLGPLDPSKNSTYRFLNSLFQEIMGVFKDSHLHLGGDEVPLGCWQSNPEVTAFANELARKAQGDQSQRGQQQQQQVQQLYYNSNTWNQWSDEIKQVYEYYENRLIKSLNEIARKRKKPVHYIMWQEVINNNLQLPNDTIIQVWMGDMADVMRATSMGYRVIYSTCWYLDHIEYGTKWPKYYQCDPVDQSYGYHIDEKKVLGGEAAFWSEYFSNENLIPLMWPRASAIAERLWSNKEVKNLDTAAERLSEHRCRMIKRGINAGEISGPGYCLHSPPKRRLFNETMGCKGANCSRSHNFVEIEDIKVHLSQRGGSLTDCGKLFHHGSSSVPILMAIILVLVLALVAVTRSSSRLHRIRLCKNRFILLSFVVLLLIYFLCYTSVWMRAFEFSGSIHKTVQEEKTDKLSNVDSFKDQNFLPS